MEARGAFRNQIAIDAGAVVVLLDQFDLDGARLGNRDLHVDHRLVPAVHAGSLEAREHVEGPDAVDARPARCRCEQVVDDATELEQSVLALGPWLFVVAVRH